jgi:hypothetical protein
MHLRKSLNCLAHTKHLQQKPYLDLIFSFQQESKYSSNAEVTTDVSRSIYHHASVNNLPKLWSIMAQWRSCYTKCPQRPFSIWGHIHPSLSTSGPSGYKRRQLTATSWQFIQNAVIFFCNQSFISLDNSLQEMCFVIFMNYSFKIIYFGR